MCKYIRKSKEELINMIRDRLMFVSIVEFHDSKK
jgi:hypothetical protein